MNKQIIRLTESDLHNIIRESVNKILNETKKSNKNKYNINPDDIDIDIDHEKINKAIYPKGIFPSGKKETTNKPIQKKNNKKPFNFKRMMAKEL